MTILSVFVFISGAVVAALAIRFALGGSFFNLLNADGTPADVNVARFKNISFGILLGAGIIALLTGFYGFFFMRCKDRCFAVWYGIFLSFTWIIILILGCVVTAVSYGSQSTLTSFCAGTLNSNNIANMISSQI